MPIAGRVVDLEGRPVPGVTVRPVILSASANGDLTAWEAAMAKTKTIYDRPGLSHTMVPELELYRWINDFATTTDADGRFRMTGIGASGSSRSGSRGRRSPRTSSIISPGRGLARPT